MSVATSSPVADAYQSALEEVLPAARIGRGVKSHAGKPPADYYPYAVLSVGTTLMSGTLVDPKEDGLHRVQVTCVGRKSESCEQLRDEVRPILLDTSIHIDGYVIVSTEAGSSPPPIRFDNTPEGTVFEAVTIVNVKVTPANTGS